MTNTLRNENIEAERNPEILKFEIEILALGPTLSYEDLSKLLKRTTTALRRAVCQPRTDFERKLGLATIKFGSRTYFRTSKIVDLYSVPPDIQPEKQKGQK